MKRREKDNKGIILGIDPGSRKCGYGVLSFDGKYVASGTIALSNGKPLAVRLKELYAALTETIKEYGPSVAAVEKVFFANSVRSALSLGHARGIVLLAVANGGLEFNEYSPLEVKKAVTGYGMADKSQVQQMVKSILGLDFRPSPDGADALALAICHLQRAKYAKAVEGR